ncbi:O-antigen polymerase [uncultured Winogradskyella sp.]|uniref:O-antigen polymerase n=1 Tax=uncultured Winogradskyella sp. TaxID=395353 RepID=UPI002632DE16|nr:O-antigen polymerase [uncultured Winogradskyella sp.]
MNKAIIKTQYRLYVFLLVIVFIGDILRRIAMHFDYSFIRYTTLSKTVFVLVSFLCLIFLFRKITFKNNLKVNIIKLMLSLSLIYILGHFYFTNNSSIAILCENFIFLAKYLFFPYLLILFLDLRKEALSIQRLLKFFEILFFINLGAIIIGYIFSIDMFLTYDSGKRFGYKGIYSMSGQTSIYFILMVLYYLHKIIFKKYSLIIFLKLIIVILGSFLIGTKRIYLFVPMLIVYYFFFLGGYKKKITYQLSVPVSLLAFLLFITIKKDLQKTFDVLYSIYETKGLLSSLTSYRSDLFTRIYSTTIVNDWTFWNFLFGGLNFSEQRTEMGFVDLFLFFGVIGFLIYLYFYKVLFQFKFSHSFYWFFIFSLFAIVFLADAFILEANTPILFLLLCFHFYNHEQGHSVDS